MYTKPLRAALYFIGATMASAAKDIQSRDDSRGTELVEGLGNRKQCILKAGGNTIDFAIAMLEIIKMGTDYVYGDAKPFDAANFRIFKQNWGMLRIFASRSGFVGYSENEWNDGAELKTASSVTAWINGLLATVMGNPGSQSPNTEDIQRYKSAVKWIQGQIDADPKYKTTDIRLRVDVKTI